MRKYFIFCSAFILIACSTPAAQVVSTEGLTAPPATPAIPSAIPATSEPQSFFTVLGEDPIVPNGNAGAWDDRFTDPGAVVYYNGMFHMFRNGFRGFPATSQVGYVTSPDGYTWTKQGEEPIFETKDVAYAKVAMYASSTLVEKDGTWVIYFYTWDSSTSLSSVIGRATAKDPKGPWAADVEPVLQLGPPGEWDAKQVLALHVIQTNDGYIMYYIQRNEQRWRANDRHGNIK